MPPRRTTFESLKDHLIKQVSWAHQARRIRPETFNEFGPWAGLKLYCLHHYIHVYATILPDWLARLGMDAMVYGDILAVSGLNRIKPSSHRALALPRVPPGGGDREEGLL